MTATMTEVAPEPTDDRALRVRDLRVTARSRLGEPVPIVRGVDLDAQPGEAVGLVGESGSGKSITALSLLRLLPPGLAQQGRIEIGGRDLSGMPDRELRGARGSLVSMVFQDPMCGLNPVRTVGSVLVEALRRHRAGLSRGQARQRAVTALHEVGIPSPAERMGAYPHQLSGGLRQRVMIAMALLHEPAVIVADEPTTALDATVQAQVLELLRERVTRSALLLITHDLGVAAELCDRIAVMYAGRVVEIGRTRDLLTRPRHPYTAGLLAAIPRFDRSRTALASIPGTPPSPYRRPPGCPFADRCPRRLDRCTVDEPELDGTGATRSACWNPHD